MSDDPHGACGPARPDASPTQEAADAVSGDEIELVIRCQREDVPVVAALLQLGASIVSPPVADVGDHLVDEIGEADETTPVEIVHDLKARGPELVDVEERFGADIFSAPTGSVTRNLSRARRHLRAAAREAADAGDEDLQADIGHHAGAVDALLDGATPDAVGMTIPGPAEEIGADCEECRKRLTNENLSDVPVLCKKCAGEGDR